MKFQKSFTSNKGMSIINEEISQQWNRKFANQKTIGYQKKLTDKQETELTEIITTQTPEEADVGVFANWTAALICHLVKEKYGVKYSERRMRDLLKRSGLSYTRPTYTLAKADPKKQEEFKEKFYELKKTDG